MRKEVQRGALAGEQRAGAARDRQHRAALLAPNSLRNQPLEAGVRVEQRERDLGGVQAVDDAGRLLRDQRVSARLLGHGRRRGHVARADANGAGFVHGGTVMKLCDEAAGLAAVKHSRCRVVTASMDRMTFMVPIHVAELVTFQASVNAVWHTSMEVGVRVDTENPRTGQRRHSNSAYLTMVAVDEHGKPVQVPPLLANNDEELRRESEAQLRRRNRLAEREQILASR